MAPIHCLKQCRLIISKTHWCLSKQLYQRYTSHQSWKSSSICFNHIFFKSPRGQWVKYFLNCWWIHHMSPHKYRTSQDTVSHFLMHFLLPKHISQNVLAKYFVIFVGIVSAKWFSWWGENSSLYFCAVFNANYTCSCKNTYQHSFVPGCFNNWITINHILSNQHSLYYISIKMETR